MGEINDLSKSASRVQQALSQKGLNFKVIELPASARTAQEAADALDCAVSQIVKSLVFRTQPSNQPALVLASGTNRVNEKILSNYLGEEITKADANFVREVTGYAIGGIPPLGHKMAMKTFIDEDLLQYDELWAAAGTPHAVFSLRPSDLQNITQGRVVAVK